MCDGLVRGLPSKGNFNDSSPLRGRGLGEGPRPTRNTCDIAHLILQNEVRDYRSRAGEKEEAQKLKLYSRTVLAYV